MNCSTALSWNFLLNFPFITVLNEMEFGKFMDLIYFSLFTLSVNFPNHLVIEMSEPILKG